MKDELELINAVKKRIEEVYEIAEKKFEMSLPRPVVTFRVKGRVAGRAYYSRNEIDLNRTLLVQNGDAFISNTPGHEAAHLIARHVFGGNIKPHGVAWQHVMKQKAITFPQDCTMQFKEELTKSLALIVTQKLFGKN